MMLISEEIGPRRHHHVFFRNEFSSQMELNRGGFTGGKGGAAAPPRTPLGELTALPQNPQLVGRGLAAPSPRTPSPLSALRASHLGPTSLASRPYGPRISALRASFLPPPSANPKNAPGTKQKIKPTVL